MNASYSRFIIKAGSTIKDALLAIDKAGTPVATLFIVDDDKVVTGTLTDGDIRRGLIRGVPVDSSVEEIMHREFRFITKDDLKNYRAELDALRKKDIRFIPVTDKGRLADIIDLEKTRDMLPVDAFILAGGRGERLLPATREVPKPLIVIGDKPILEHNIDRMLKYGVGNIYISINYLGDKIESYFGNGSQKGINIYYVREQQFMGTIGSISLALEKLGDEILVMNSDLLTNIDFSDFYKSFHDSGADMAVAVKPFYHDLPYAVIQAGADNMIHELREKPRFTYYSNAGIYLIKKKMLNHLDSGFMDATTLIERLIEKGHKVYSYPLLNYWLDIGKPEDLKKAMDDIRHLPL